MAEGTGPPRCPDHRRRPQRPRVRRLPRRRGPQGHRARAARRGRRGGGHRGVPPGIPQFRRRLHRLAPESQGHPRPRPAGPRPAAWSSGARPTSCPPPTGAICSPAGRARVPEVARFSARDAARLNEYGERLEAIADVLRDLVLQTPPNVLEGSWRSALPQLVRAAQLGGRLRRLDMNQRRELLALFAMSAGDYLDQFVRERPDQGGLRLRRHRRQLRQPLLTGLRLRAAAPRVRRGERQARRLGPRDRRHGRHHAGDGARRERARRARSALGTPVREVLVEGDRAVGVVTAGGRDAARRGGDLQPQPEAAVPGPDRPAGAAGAVPRAHEPLPLRLGHVPHERGAERAAGLHLPAGQAAPPITTPPASSSPRRSPTWSAPTSTPATHGWSRAPIVEVVIPSTLDDSLAPPGQHVASLFCQHVAPTLPERGLLGRAPRGRRRPHDRHGQRPCAELQGRGARAPDHESARSRAHLRARRRGHHARAR